MMILSGPNERHKLEARLTDIDGKCEAVGAQGDPALEPVALTQENI